MKKINSANITGGGDGARIIVTGDPGASALWLCDLQHLEQRGGGELTYTRTTIYTASCGWTIRRRMYG